MQDQVVSLFGVEFQSVSLHDLLSSIKDNLDRQQKSLILSGNVHGFNLVYEQGWLRDFFNRASLIRIDGSGLRLGGQLLGYKLPPRMTWADFAWDLAALCERHDFSLFFLGAKPGIAEKAAGQLRAKHPNLRFVGIHHGYFNKSKNHLENVAVVHKINQAQPDILVVGFGMPLQEKWLQQNWDDLDAIVTMTGGAVFDYISGNLQRAPHWMTENGLEWLGRLLIEPGRLWRRYLIGNPLFLWRVLRQRWGWLPFR